MTDGNGWDPSVQSLPWALPAQEVLAERAPVSRPPGIRGAFKVNVSLPEVHARCGWMRMSHSRPQSLGPALSRLPTADCAGLQGPGGEGQAGGVCTGTGEEGEAADGEGRGKNCLEYVRPRGWEAGHLGHGEGVLSHCARAPAPSQRTARREKALLGLGGRGAELAEGGGSPNRWRGGAKQLKPGPAVSW